MGIKPPAQMACYCNGKNISMKFTESIYFLSAEFKIKLLSSCVQHKKNPEKPVATILLSFGRISHP